MKITIPNAGLKKLQGENQKKNTSSADLKIFILSLVIFTQPTPDVTYAFNFLLISCIPCATTFFNLLIQFDK